MEKRYYQSTLFYSYLNETRNRCSPFSVTSICTRIHKKGSCRPRVLTFSVSVQIVSVSHSSFCILWKCTRGFFVSTRLGFALTDFTEPFKWATSLVFFPGAQDLKCSICQWCRQEKPSSVTSMPPSCSKSRNSLLSLIRLKNSCKNCTFTQPHLTLVCKIRSDYLS